MFWIIVLFRIAWLVGTYGINLNPFSSFTDIGLDPMTEFSVNQGVYAQNIPTSLYPFISDESFTNFVGFPGYGGFKYPNSPSGKQFNYPSSLPVSPHPNFNGNAPPGRKQKQGRGGKLPNNHMRYNNNNNNGNQDGNGNSERNNQPSVTLDIRGGGYKMENAKRRPYKAPSADPSDRDNFLRRPPSQGGRGNGGQRQRNKRPNHKSSRPKGPSMKNPYFNMKYELSMPSMSQNIEFESPENVLPLLSPSMLMQLRQQKPKFSPFLYGSTGEVMSPSMMQSLFSTSAFSGLKTVPGFYDSVKSAASQLLRGRKSQAFPLTLNPTTQISHLGLGLPTPTAVSTSGQLANQLALMQSNAEKVFGTLPQLSNDYVGQDQALFTALTKAQGGRGVLAQIQQQQIQAIKALHSPPAFQQQSALQMDSAGGPLSQYLASLDSGNTGTGQDSSFLTTHGVNYNSGNQGVEHNPRGATGLPHSKSLTPHAVDYQQMLLQQHSQNPQQFGHTPHSSSKHASHQGQMFQQKENYPLAAPYGSHQEYTGSHHAGKGNLNAYPQSPYHNSLNSVPSQGQSEFYNQQGYKNPKDSQVSYAQVNPSLHGHYSPDSKATYPQMNHYPNQGQREYRIQSYNDPNDYKSSTYQASSTGQAGQYSVYAKDKNHVTSALNSGHQSPYASYSPNNAGNSLPYTEGGEYQNQFTEHFQQATAGQDTVPVYSPSGSNQASTYSQNYMDIYQQLAAMPTDSKFGFPVTAPTNSGKTEPGDPSVQKKETVSSVASLSQSAEGQDRAALHLPGDMSVFVTTQNTQENYMYQNYPEIYRQQNYYYQDGDQMSSDLEPIESGTEDKDRRKTTEEEAPYGRKKNAGNRTSDNNKNTKKSSQKSKTKSMDSLTSSQSSQPVWTPATGSKSTSSEERKDQKTKNPSPYMIQYSPKDPVDSTASASSSSESLSPQKETTVKSDPRKYHSPVPAQQPAKASSKSASEKRQDNDYPFCARYTNTTYCLQDPEYPKEEIKDAIEKNRHPMDHFLVDISASAMEEPLVSSLSYSFEGNVVASNSDINTNNSGCASNVYFSKPLRAINTSGQWKIIVNVEFGDTGANYTQTVRLDECISKKDGSPTACGVEPISACIQQYKLYRLLSWEKDKGFSIDAFLLPVSCLCGNTVSSTTPTTVST